MKSVISRSLLPALSCSRIWFRRSTASGAWESASVWFWHTRQRSSCARLVTRRSRFGSSCAREGRAKTIAINSSVRRSLATLGKLLDQRAQLLRRNLLRERADVLVADDALAIDDVGLGYAVHPVVDGDAPGGVVDRDLEGIAVALEPGQRVLARVLVVEADHRRDARGGELAHHRVLHEARRAPRGPHVQHPHLAQHVLLREGLVRLVQERQVERRRGLADERGRHLAGIELQADREQADEHEKARDDEPEPQGGAALGSQGATLGS